MEYVFKSAEQKAEFERLKLLEDAFDEKTKELIQTSGIALGWSCLELGPGAGSILRWMSDSVGKEGKVVGIDKNTKNIEGINAKQVDKIEGDILDLELEFSDFDLIHARYVLIHVTESEKVIKKLIKLLKPGGVIILEEPDFTAAQVVDDRLPSGQAHQRVNEAMNQMFIDLGFDPSFGIQLPLILQRNGVRSDKIIGDRHLCCGNSKIARMMGHSTATLRDKYISTQKASEQDVQTYIKNSANENFWAVYYSTISVIGKK
jgi:SAM-dependent methyltransferase